MPESVTPIESRIRALEDQVFLLSKRMDELTEAMHAVGAMRGSSSPGATTFHAFHSTNPEGDASSLESSLDRLFRSDLFMHLATLCYVLVVALVLRIITENQLIPIPLGIFLGISYCAGLVLWSLLPHRGADSTARTIGVTGLIVLGLLVFEAHHNFHQISLFTAFFLLLAAMFAAVTVGWKYDTPVVGWMGLLLPPILFFVMGYPEAEKGWGFTFLALATACAFGGESILRLWPARGALGIMVLLALFSWNRDLYRFFYDHSQSPFVTPAFLWTTLAFAGLYLVPSLFAAWIKRSLSYFEKVAPSASVSVAYYFSECEQLRRGLDQGLYASLGLLASALLLTIGFGFGVRNRPQGYGLRTFLCAGVVLLILSSTDVLHSVESQTLLWSLCAVAFLWLAMYFECPDLRFLSFLLHAVVFLIVSLKSALTYSESHPWATMLSCYLGVAMLFHYGMGRFGARGSGSERLQGSDRFAMVLLVCSLMSFYYFGRNVLIGIAGVSPLTTCLQSTWLTLLASITFFEGTRGHNRDFEITGFLAFGVAGSKVFIWDVWMGVGHYFAVSVFFFGALAGICSFFTKSRRSPVI